MSDSRLSHKHIGTSTGSVPAINTENITNLKAFFGGIVRLLPPIPVAARSKACVFLRPLACWDSGFESCRGHGCLLLWVLSGTGLCDRPIPHPEESYRVRVCVIECHQAQQ